MELKRISRRSFLYRSLQVGSLSAASAALGACTVVPAPPATVGTPVSTGVPTLTPLPPDPNEGSLALARVAEVEKVAKIAGEGSINETGEKYGLYGTDLGSMFDMGDRVYMAFGDSFGCCIPGTGGPGMAGNWRSNVMAVISDRDPSDGLTFDDMITDRPGHAKELVRASAFDRTLIPTYGVAVGERMFLHYMAVLAWGNPGEWLLNNSGLAYSDDGGHTWTKDENAKWDSKSNFGQVAIVKRDADLYFFGIPGGRFGGVKLAKVAQASILDKSAYRYFAGLADGLPQWHEDEEFGELIVSPPVGELSVIWNLYLRRWIMTCLDESRASIVIREAPELWGTWSNALSLVSGMAYPGLYGAYMHPWYIENDGEIIYFAMSQWGPYGVFWMRARLVRN